MSSGDNPSSLYAEILILWVQSQQWWFKHREIIYIALAHGEFQSILAKVMTTQDRAHTHACARAYEPNPCLYDLTQNVVS